MLMRRQTCLCLIVLLVCSAAGVAQDKRPIVEKPRNIILIGWDGAQRNHVNECLQRGELPALKRLAAEGTMVEIDIKGTTDTKAGWSQILTGYNPQVTGVYSNSRYQPVPKGYSIFERLEEHFGPDKFVTVAVIGKKGHCGEIDGPKKVEIKPGQADAPKRGKKAAAAGEEGKKKAGKGGAARDKQDDQENAPKKPRKAEPGSRIVQEGGKTYRVIPGKPYYNMHSACDLWHFGLMKDQVVGTRAMAMLEKHKDGPFFFFVHFAEVDHSGHRGGENSKPYNDALISNDLWTGKILDKLKELGIYDKTLVYVTADHGFDEGAKHHKNAPYVFLATNDAKVKSAGLRVDVAPTIYDRFGLDGSKFNPPLDGKSLAR